jgi:DNA-binding NtrC family response regulator
MEVQLSFKMDVFSKLRKMKILLIDDDEWIRDSLSIFFEAEGCQLMAFETAEEGIDELKDQTYDLIIVDYKLPGLDGLEFIKRTQNALSDAIKVLITAYRNDKVVSEAKKLKVQGFIEKPFTYDSFMASLVHLIAMHEYREQKKIHE